MNLWTSKDAVKATNGISKINWVADGISIDTRNIKPGDLFVALKDKRDGHEFVKAAFEKGASAALVSKVPDGVNENFPLLVVEDVFGALQSMAKFARARTKAKIIGVTGSVGKTSTKEMLKTILTENGKTHAAEKSYNNHWGVPLTLARMPKNSDFAIIEIGMNSPNEIRPLAKLAALDVAIVLNVAPVHLKAFKNVEEIAFAKAEI
ncbi:UDP-N-acetylmuramoyl-tripeptide--D-alanyl-D-alanine ligase, partial [Amylibacter sp.]|nr:UDP-N-acetylmuramoyl-tripeptide--D-alanyl-D-alanine ligase [Amylibacter sp.]